MPITNIKPFKAIIYNQEKIKDLSRVVCPPYDVISPEKQQYYHDLDLHNLIHIILRKDNPAEDKYKVAGVTFNEWFKDKILIEDQKSAVYFYSQQYNIRGEKKRRLGFIALLRLGDENSAVYGHEHTRLPAKEDRLRLLKQVKANLSPIFCVFLDHKRIIQRLYEQHIQSKAPFVDITDNEKTVHKLWRIDSPEILANIQKSMSGENIFIADGHHRYEVACNYRELMRQRLKGPSSAEESFNYILSYFTNTDPRGLSILPIHRLVKLVKKTDLEDFKLKLKNHFDIDEFKDKAKFFFLMEKGGLTEHVIGIYRDKKYFLLRLKNIKILDKEIQDKSKEYKSLDVSILNTLVLQKILGLSLEDKERLKFSPDTDELIKEVDNNPDTIAFFLNPVKFEQIVQLSLKGERMPAKTTYFYPKVLSGLVINKLK